MRFDTTTPPPLSPEQLEALVPKLIEAGRGNETVVLLYLHGSYAQGTQAPLSDIDLAVLLESDRSRDYRLVTELLLAFQEICGRDDVDLVVLNTAGPLIQDRVVRHGRLLYAKTEAQRVRFEAWALKRAMDFRYYSRVYDDAMFDRLREGHFLD